VLDLGLFDRARGAWTCQALAERETDLFRAGSELRGVCPLCGAGKARSASAPFAVKPNRDSWACYVCDKGGDVTDLEVALRGGTLVEAARRLIGDATLPAAVKPRPKPKAPEGPSASDRIALDLWREGRAFAGSIAERYLAGRGIPASVLALAGPAMRFHPNAKWAWDEARGRWIHAPALLLQVVTPAPDGTPVPTGGVHATYLDPKGRGKAALDPAKRMWGPQGQDGKRGVAWLFGDPRAAPMTMLTGGEGLESVLSLVALTPGSERGAALAALSLDRLQGGILKDQDRCIDVYEPRPDPERPPATWPGRWVASLAIDRDMSPLKVRARTGRDKIGDFVLEGEARARLCARLAVAGWAAAGAYSARAVAPPPGLDFNNELMRRVARTGETTGEVA
jgi:CHC2 zinc finger